MTVSHNEFGLCGKSVHCLMQSMLSYKSMGLKIGTAEKLLVEIVV